MADVAESIGRSATVHINDGSASAYVIVDNLVDFDPPDPVLGTVESKRLTLPSNVLVEVPTIFKAGQAKLKWQFGQANWTRMDGLRTNMTKKNFKFTVNDDTSTTVVICAGYVTSNKRMKVEADKIQEVESTITLTGPTSAS